MGGDWRWQLLPLALFAAAGVAFFTGRNGAALMIALVGMVGQFVMQLIGRRRAKDVVLPEVTAEQDLEIRDMRARAGEIHAIRCLRVMHPGLSLLDAVQYVRNLV